MAAEPRSGLPEEPQADVSAEPGSARAVTVPAPGFTDLPEKLDRLDRLAEREGLDTLVLRDQASLAWLLGARVHVPQTLDSACLDVVVERSPSGPRLRVVTNAIEAPRLRDSELAGLDADWTVVPWSASRDPALPTGPGVGSDRPGPATADVAAGLAAARRVLTGRQQAVLREVCADAAEAVGAAAAACEPGLSEYEAAALVARELLARALDPVVLLVAGEEHLATHRHPLPTTGPLGRRAMLVCCARRHGLIGSVTRIVAFQPLSGAERERYAALLEVERAFLDATRPGARIGAAFSEGIAAYARNGFAPDEWQRHHQGGLSGFRTRELLADADSAAVLEEGSVVAWNPSGEGWKVEDTALVAADGPEPLGVDPGWPSVPVGGRSRPGVLERG